MRRSAEGLQCQREGERRENVYPRRTLKLTFVTVYFCAASSLIVAKNRPASPNVTNVNFERAAKMAGIRERASHTPACLDFHLFLYAGVYTFLIFIILRNICAPRRPLFRLRNYTRDTSHRNETRIKSNELTVTRNALIDWLFTRQHLVYQPGNILRAIILAFARRNDI